jgi:hypothetical protein
MRSGASSCECVWVPCICRALGSQVCSRTGWKEIPSQPCVSACSTSPQHSRSVLIRRKTRGVLRFETQEGYTGGRSGILVCSRSFLPSQFLWICSILCNNSNHPHNLRKFPRDLARIASKLLYESASKVGVIARLQAVQASDWLVEGASSSLPGGGGNFGSWASSLLFLGIVAQAERSRAWQMAPLCPVRWWLLGESSRGMGKRISVDWWGSL